LAYAKLRIISIHSEDKKILKHLKSTSFTTLSILLRHMPRLKPGLEPHDFSKPAIVSNGVVCPASGSQSLQLGEGVGPYRPEARVGLNPEP